MQKGGSEERNRGSRPAMDKGRDQIAKKPRVEAPPPSSVLAVKQEIVVHQGAGAIVAVERVPRTELRLKMDVAVLHCPICLHPLRPPVFQCKGGHLACPGCRSGGCVKCGNGAAFDIANTAMDDVVLAARMECLHAGCGSCVAYFEASDHQDACPHAPCSCTEPGCAFAAPPPELVAHLVAAHAMPVHRIPYGKVEPIQVSVPGPARVLLVGGAGEEADAFLLTLAAFGPATVVTAVCPWRALGRGTLLGCGSTGRLRRRRTAGRTPCRQTSRRGAARRRGASSGRI
uniref:Uncharacterized protein n=1 Tax=Avena sativa TaxID=4498 RepID=A0ACD5TS82_AVESA